MTFIAWAKNEPTIPHYFAARTGACCVILKLTPEFPHSPTCNFTGFGPETGGQWEREPGSQA